MRRPFVAGNWKMNLDLAGGRRLVEELRQKVGSGPVLDVAVCPPAVYLQPLSGLLAGSGIGLGAQNCWHEAKGAFTGEVSVAMLKDVGCRYVILGHSERRHTIGPKDAAGHVQGETDEMIAAKARAALAGGLTPIVCIGETLEERDAGRTNEVLKRQVLGSLADVRPGAAEALVIAYEPVWAIGTGRNATPQQAQEAHHYVRGLLAELLGKAVADGIRIQYGGSVKPDNAAELMACPDVDGALVGGASLKSSDFLPIIEATIQAKKLR